VKTPAAIVAALAAVLVSGGCSRNIDTLDAVKQGILKDIASKVDIRSMDVNVDSVSFRGQEADAQVSFSPKGGGPSQAITMKYGLERQGDEWRIKSRNMQMHEQAAHGQTTLPPGHPATGGNTPLPPGHPSVGNSPKP
jgi:hypothetical protein